MYNKKAHMLNIYYSLKTINFFKIKMVVLKHGVPIGISWKKWIPEVYTMFQNNPNKSNLPTWILLKSFWMVKWFGAT